MNSLHRRNPSHFHYLSIEICAHIQSMVPFSKSTWFCPVACRRKRPAHLHEWPLASDGGYGIGANRSVFF